MEITIGTFGATTPTSRIFFSPMDRGAALSYEIDFAVFQALSTRAGGETVSAP